jgi:hypothetical protein
MVEISYVEVIEFVWKEGEAGVSRGGGRRIISLPPKRSLISGDEFPDYLLNGNVRRGRSPKLVGSSVILRTTCEIASY